MAAADSDCGKNSMETNFLRVPITRTKAVGLMNWNSLSQKSSATSWLWLVGCQVTWALCHLCCRTFPFFTADRCIRHSARPLLHPLPSSLHKSNIRHRGWLQWYQPTKWTASFYFFLNSPGSRSESSSRSQHLHNSQQYAWENFTELCIRLEHQIPRGSILTT